MEFLHYFFIRLQLLTGFLIVFSKNPIHSILFLVMLFFESSAILVLFHVEFIALLFIVIYVGAIAVLFLFVVMMLKLKAQAFNSIALILPLFLLSVLFSFFLYSALDAYGVLSSSGLGGITLQQTPMNCLDQLKDVGAIGQFLYNYYIICFVLAGLILLVALIGAISLTLDMNKSRQNSVGFRRLSRSDNFLSFFK